MNVKKINIGPHDHDQDIGPFYLRQIEGLSNKHILLRVGDIDVKQVSIEADGEDGRIVSLDLEGGPLLYRGYDLGDGRKIEDIEEIKDMYVITTTF